MWRRWRHNREPPLIATLTFNPDLPSCLTPTFAPHPPTLSGTPCWPQDVQVVSEDGALPWEGWETSEGEEGFGGDDEDDEDGSNQHDGDGEVRGWGQG